MLFPFFIVSVFILFLAPIGGLVGYNFHNKEWADSILSYLKGLGMGLVYGLCALAFILSYVWLLGWPAPD